MSTTMRTTIISLAAIALVWLGLTGAATADSAAGLASATPATGERVDPPAGDGGTTGAAGEAQPERRRRRGGEGGGRRGGPETGGGDAGPEAGTDGADDAKKDSDADGDDEDLPKLDHEWLAITGGTVHTVSGGVMPGATILCKDGVIHAIGRRVPVPEDATVVDASGQHVYPGLVAVKSSGFLGGGNPASSTDVFNFNMTLALAAGITTTTSGSTAAKLSYGSLDGHVVRGGLYETLRYDTRDPRGRKRIREGMDRVRGLLRDLDRHEREKATNPEAKKPDEAWVRGPFATYRRLLEGDAVARMSASDAHELSQVCDLAEQYGIKIVVDGAVEGWTMPERLGRAGVSVILVPRAEVAPNTTVDRPTGSSIQNAAILRQHGVSVAVMPSGSLFGPGERISLGGLAGRDLQHLPMAAAFAVRGGLSNAEGVRTITLDAARILGIDDRVGSIEIGKDADFAITDGDLLHYMTLVQKTIVNGKVAYDKAEDTLFSHIRPLEGAEAETPGDYWPRRLGDTP